jgi:hypothetical protein
MMFGKEIKKVLGRFEDNHKSAEARHVESGEMGFGKSRPLFEIEDKPQQRKKHRSCVAVYADRIRIEMRGDDDTLPSLSKKWSAFWITNGGLSWKAGLPANGPVVSRLLRRR